MPVTATYTLATPAPAPLPVPPKIRQRAVELVGSALRLVWPATLKDNMASFWIRSGDTGRPLVVLLKNMDGSDAVIPAGSTCLFRMVHRQTGRVVSGACTLADGPLTAGASNQVTYPFSSAADTAQPGEYDAEWVVTYPSGGGSETFPTRPPIAGAAWAAQTSFVVEVAPRTGDSGLLT